MKNPIIGLTVTVTVDRTLGSFRPEQPDICYPINCGYIKGIIAFDGEYQGAYILGVDEPVPSFTGKVIAIIRRLDDVENKWVVCPDGMSFTKEEIARLTEFQERSFKTEIIL